MFHTRWFQIAALATLAAAALVAFLLSRDAIRGQIASQAARRSFGQSTLNILILGYQDDEATTDTIALAHLDVTRRTATIVSVPRDSWVATPGQRLMKINAAYAYGGAHATARAVSRLLGGVPIDAIVALQPEGAAAIVDAIGGLDVNVDEDMDYDDDAGGLHIHLKKGQQHLTGAQLAGYVRFRHDATSDFGRMRRQQQVLGRIVDRIGEPQNWLNLPSILRLARKNVHTTLSDRQAISLLTIYRDVPAENIRAFTLPSHAGWAGDASVVFVDPRWAKYIGSLLFAKREPPQDEVLVVNATGDAAVDATIVGALRGAGWNVPTFVDEAIKRKSVVTGATPAAATLARTFAASLRPGAKTSIVLGADLAPN